MKILNNFAIQPLLSMGFNISQIFLYKAESLPIVYSRRFFGISKPPNPAPPENHEKVLTAEIFKMLNEDYKNISEGLYSLDSFNSISPAKHAKRYLRLLIDSAASAKRAKNNKYKEFSEIAKKHAEGLPSYYKRNFHYQTDGYLSEDSADLYEHQTEILFMGTLGLMRRLLLAKLISIIKKKSGGFRVLEIGAGTGEATEILARSSPNISVVAIDLSKPYISKAKQKLSGFDNVELIQADGLTYKSKEKFDAVVSCFCFHEMPLKVRKQIIQNAASNLKSGGYLLIVDSLQIGERSDLDWALKQFPKDFHEPFYTNYVKTPLKTLLNEDLELINEESRFLSKSLLARKV
jgi:ubiquinone/menaquinone biosynthesis C-methylase UbiE